MPKYLRRQHKRLDTHLTLGLVTGRFYFDFNGGRDVEAIRVCWEEHREHVLEDFINEHPGERPWAWWKFDSREPRRQLAGAAWLEECPEWGKELVDGVPRVAPPLDPDNPVEYESQADYLERLGLLTVQERHALAE